MGIMNAELAEQIAQLSAQLKLLNAQVQPTQKASPWLPLREAASLLHCTSARVSRPEFSAGASRLTATANCPHPLAKAARTW